jgi:PTS system nitrogen regulatory IIA component
LILNDAHTHAGTTMTARHRSDEAQMNLLPRLLPLHNVVIDLDVGSKKRVFEHAGLLFENFHNIARSQVFDSLFAREKLCSTGLGKGIAIPHGRIKGLREAVAAMIRTREPIAFDAPDGLPVSLVFVLLVPQRATDLHLRILSELAQMFSDGQFRDRLMSAASAEAMHRMITEWRPNAESYRSTAV